MDLRAESTLAKQIHTVPLTISYHQFRFIIGSYSAAEI